MTGHRYPTVLARQPGEKRHITLRRIFGWFGVAALVVGIGVVASAAQARAANGQARSSVGSAARASSNVVIDWNRTLVDALLVAHTAPQPGTRIGAIVQTSVFDAVNGIKGRYTQFHPEVLTTNAPRGASAPAAAAGAAYTALVALFPTQKPTFDAQLAATLATLSNDDKNVTRPPVTRGLAWGQTVANAILASRAADGFTATLPAYMVGPLPSWQPTPPAFAPPAWRQFATMTPWAMTSPGQFLPAPQPALTSARYAQDFNEVKTIGAAATSTPELITTARFWGGQFDTVATIWNRVGESLAAEERMSLVDNARFFALLNSSMADAVIAVWNAKNAYNTWRPVTAIRNADVDGNAATTVDPAWTPVLITPAFQEYPSGHSGVSTAATTVLASFFGNDTTFTVSSDGVPGEPRTYSSFSDVVDEIALARIAGGIHFRFACDAAQQIGAAVADYTTSHELLPMQQAQSLPVRGATQDLLVANQSVNTIREFSPSGEDLGDFATTGLSGPTGLAFDKRGNLYVSNINGNTIREFTPAGVDLGNFATTGLSSPRGIAFDKHGDLYVANTSWIRKFSPTGADLGNFASTGLNVARGIAFDTRGDLYVANAGDNTIRRFSRTGEDLGFFASTGFIAPALIAFDKRGNLYVTNFGGNTIREFSPTGADLGNFASTGLSAPAGLAFDKEGNLYVSNRGDGTIREFSSNGADLGYFATGLVTPVGLAFRPGLEAEDENDDD